jgi:hypothetical protein
MKRWITLAKQTVKVFIFRRKLKNSPRRHERLYGYRRYDPKDGGGRIASGTAIESNAGAIAEERSTRRKTIQCIENFVYFVPSW